MRKTQATTDILNAKQLAESIGKSAEYVTAMKRAGYVFLYGRLTTRRHALQWLAMHLDFIPSHFMGSYWKASKAEQMSQPV